MAIATEYKVWYYICISLLGYKESVTFMCFLTFLTYKMQIFKYKCFENLEELKKWTSIFGLRPGAGLRKKNNKNKKGILCT